MAPVRQIADRNYLPRIGSTEMTLKEEEEEENRAAVAVAGELAHSHVQNFDISSAKYELSAFTIFGTSI
jgi:hypothetical protein